MTQRSTQSRAGSPCAFPRFCIVCLCFLAAVCTGCAAQQTPKAKTFPWATAKTVRPVLLPKPLGSPSDSGESDFLAEVELDVPPPPSPLAAIQSTPQRPRVAAAPSGQSNPARPEPPQIAPQLTAEETAAAQQQTNLSLSIAERNIAAARGRMLNAAQSDLASKVRNFVNEARDAAHVGDWTRASSAAKKAQVLSEELAASF
jgi:hypothetical protein